MFQPSFQVPRLLLSSTERRRPISFRRTPFQPSCQVLRLCKSFRRTGQESNPLAAAGCRCCHAVGLLACPPPFQPSCQVSLLFQAATERRLPTSGCRPPFQQSGLLQVAAKRRLPTFGCHPTFQPSFRPTGQESNLLAATECRRRHAVGLLV
jgi:hypothetical protein